MLLPSSKTINSDLVNAKFGVLLEEANFGSLNELAYYTRPIEEEVAAIIFNQLVKGLKNIHNK